jgi:Zn ribbon nucleic-acid-binding protein
MGSPCIDCHSHDTEIVWYDDGHFRKECADCGYIGGPYVSSQGSDEYGTEEKETSQNVAESVFDY